MGLMPQTPTVWRLKTKPNISTEARAHFIDLMLEREFIATGWMLPSEPDGIESCLELLRDSYPGRKSAPAQRFVRDTRLGDLVWIVDTKKGVFHLAQIRGNYHYKLSGDESGPEAVHRFDVNWIERGLAPQDVPGGIKNAFRVGSTYCRVRDKASRIYSGRLAGTDFQGSEITDFIALLDDRALEDLVGLYLQYKLNGPLIPSTAKSDTAAIEFVVKSWDGKRTAVVQVKSGTQRISDNLNGWTVERFLFASSGGYPDTLDGAQVIDRKLLIKFACEFKSILPKTVRCWMDVTQSVKVA